MPRRPNIVRPVRLNTVLPEDIRTQLDIHLYSDVEGCIPQGAYQSFLLERIREYFNRKALDTGFGVVYGPPETIERLRIFMEESSRV